MRKRFIAIVVAIIIALGLLTGCGGAKITQSSTEVEETNGTSITGDYVCHYAVTYKTIE